MAALAGATDVATQGFQADLKVRLYVDGTGPRLT